MEREQLNFYLQQVDGSELFSLRNRIEHDAKVELIQKPVSQTLLVPVKDPINRGSFYSGEVLVSSAIVQVNSINGWSMVMDDDPELAVTIAVLDGAFSADVRKDEIIELARQGMEQIQARETEQNARINATRVNFDLL